MDEYVSDVISKLESKSRKYKVTEKKKYIFNAIGSNKD